MTIPVLHVLTIYQGVGEVPALPRWPKTRAMEVERWMLHEWQECLVIRYMTTRRAKETR